MTGYRTGEILEKHVSIFYPPDDVAIGKPTTELTTATKAGRFEDDGWRERKDGSQFWANAVVTPLLDEAGRVRGFVKITRDTTEKRTAEQELLRRSAELEAANKELESFSYSVSHDLRALLRGIDGFRQALEEDDAGRLDAAGKNYLARICAGARRMGVLIDDLINLARVTRLSAMPQVVLLDLKLPRMVGFEVLERIRSREATKLLPVVILTTANEDHDRLRGYGLGANSFAGKPVEFDKFIEAVRQLGLYWLIPNQPAPAPRRT